MIPARHLGNRPKQQPPTNHPAHDGHGQASRLQHLGSPKIPDNVMGEDFELDPEEPLDALIMAMQKIG